MWWRAWIDARSRDDSGVSTRVHVIGTGLIGASLGIALSRNGYAVSLDDASPTARQLAVDLGAGALAHETDEAPDLVVVATPPDVAPTVVGGALLRWPDAIVTDVASVKGAVLAGVAQVASPEDLSRYVGGHPMAGRERSGAAAARSDLFEGRTWVVVPHNGSRPDATALVTRMARDTGAVVVTLDAPEHDDAVAAVSHVPQVVASLVAASLLGQPESQLRLAGQGLRDVTRIAASDPRLWVQILAGNATAIRAALADVQDRLAGVVDALARIEAGAPEGTLAVLSRLISDGNQGYAQIPGKHGAAPTAYEIVGVVVPDTPGELARLLTDVGAAGVNLEDLHIEHGLGQAVGLAEIVVVPGAVARLREALSAKGWRVHE